MTMECLWYHTEIVCSASVVHNLIKKKKEKKEKGKGKVHVKTLVYTFW